MARGRARGTAEGRGHGGRARTGTPRGGDRGAARLVNARGRAIWVLGSGRGDQRGVPGRWHCRGHRGRGLRPSSSGTQLSLERRGGYAGAAARRATASQP
eukprot:5123479-Pleurochrysis_carterae.AAC.1